MKKECGKNRECVKGEKFEQKGVPIHSQVRKIKQESSEKIVDWSPGQPEIRPVFRELIRQVSRSRLGTSGRPISVGDS
ncbi:hypothetical protein Lal_00029940 [Lupinus albus]|uniref:Uncharacterized protein n=1 Tax=Lupinus albus TaxID=3870 RepID=A0A6A4P470_LUPAL|nr:hypothetical protein Lalb_Chr16g0386911 [Lupinus albus]KAF1874513.1 hypothetical protein Lal_00029940 [Lupinus albus]